jgi:probable phosphoglycerate mutase
MSKPLRLFLVRHGETVSNREMRYLGSHDEPLADSGLRQAERLAEALARLPVRAVYTSPLRRAAETGHPIAVARDLDLRLEPRLREQCFGAWEGLTRGEVLAGDGREELLRWEADLALPPPGGESLAAVQERVLELVGELARDHAGAWVALVSHVGPIKALLCAALGVPLAAARRMFLDPGTLSVVDWGERPVLRLFNAHGHLGWEEARWMGEAGAAVYASTSARSAG